MLKTEKKRVKGVGYSVNMITEGEPAVICINGKVIKTSPVLYRRSFLNGTCVIETKNTIYTILKTNKEC